MKLIIYKQAHMGSILGLRRELKYFTEQFGK